MNKGIYSSCKYWTKAMMIAAVAICPVTLVSCGDDYDDTILKEQIEDLKSRIEQLESKLNTEVQSLKDLIDGKITVTSCTLNETTKVYTIKLSDGTVMEIAQNNTNVPNLTFITEGNERYWAVVKNGATEALLDAQGNKIPVSVKAPQIRINATSHELELSVDGGTTWKGTGAFAADSETSIFTKVETDEKSVYFTLSDGTVLCVDKTSEFDVTALSGKQYFTHGETKTVKIEMTGVKDFMISKPDGWKASIKEDNLTITAPAEDNASADQEGEVSIMSVSNNEKSLITKISVEIGTAPLTIKFDKTAMKASFGSVYAYVGACKLADFTPETIVSYIQDPNSELKETSYSVNEYTMQELLGYAPVKGEAYIVWAMPQGGYNAVYNALDLIYACYSTTDVTMKVLDTSFEDATLSIQIAGAKKYYGGMQKKDKFNADKELSSLNSGYYSNPITGTSYEGMLKKFATTSISGNATKFGTTYVVYVIPYEEDKEEYGSSYYPTRYYTLEDIYTMEVTLDELTTGGSCTATFSNMKSNYQDVAVTITPSSDTYKFYHKYYTEEEMNAFAGDEAIIKDLTAGTAETEIIPYDAKQSYLSPGAKGYFAAVSIDKEGKTGTLAKIEANAKALVYNETITVQAEATNLTHNSVTINLSATGGTVSKYRYINPASQGSDDADIEGKLALNQGWDIKETTEATVTLDVKTNIEYTFYVIGIDANDVPTHMTKVTYTPELNIEMIANTDASWAASKATITNFKIVDYSPYSQNIMFTLTPATNVEKTFVYVQSRSEYSGMTAEEMTKHVILNGTECTGEKAFDTYERGSDKNYVIGIVSMNSDGKYYQAYFVDPYTNQEVNL